MLATTTQIIRSALQADPSLNPRDRVRLLALIRDTSKNSQGESATHPEPRLLRRKQAAEKLAVSLRTLDKLCSTGILSKRVLPGRKRASGIPADQVDTLIAGTHQEAA